MDFTSITNSWGYILSGAAYTVQLTAITAAGGLFLGTLLALCHISEKRWLSAPAKRRDRCILGSFRTVSAVI